MNDLQLDCIIGKKRKNKTRTWRVSIMLSNVARRIHIIDSPFGSVEPFRPGYEILITLFQ